jgi:hypothetical protein
MEIIHNNNAPVQRELTPFELKGKAVHETCEKKVNQLVVNYFRDAKDDSLGAKHYFDKYNNEWKVFVTIKNKQQRYVRVEFNAFELRVEYIMNHAQQMEQQKEAALNENDSVATETSAQETN